MAMDENTMAALLEQAANNPQLMAALMKAFESQGTIGEATRMANMPYEGATQVKGGMHVQPGWLSALNTTMERETGRREMKNARGAESGAMGAILEALRGDTARGVDPAAVRTASQSGSPIQSGAAGLYSPQALGVPPQGNVPPAQRMAPQGGAPMGGPPQGGPPQGGPPQDPRLAGLSPQQMQYPFEPMVPGQGGQPQGGQPAGPPAAPPGPPEGAQPITMENMSQILQSLIGGIKGGPAMSSTNTIMQLIKQMGA